MSDESENERILLSAILYSSKDEFIDKFLKLSGRPNLMKTSNYHEMVVDFYNGRVYQGKSYFINFWVAKSLFSPDKYWEKLYNAGTPIVLIHTDENDTNYVSKLRETIDRFKSDYEAKYILVFDKESMNQRVKESIKSLLVENTVQGIHGIDSNEPDTANKLFEEIIRVYNSD